MDDEQIIRLYWDRNELAISATADKYGNYCTSIAANILGNREDAQECVNDTYMNAWNAIPPHQPRVLSTFLGKIVRNLSYNRYRLNTAGKRGGGQIPLVLEELSELVSGREDVEQELQAMELKSAIHAFLGSLPPQKRAIFIRRYWYTDSIAQIAQRYDMSQGAVTMILSRLRQKLRRHLLEGGFDL